EPVKEEAVQQEVFKQPEPVKEEAKEEKADVVTPEAKKPEPIALKKEVVKPVAAKQEVKPETGEPEEETLITQYQKRTGPKISGDKIDLSQFNKPKKKKEDKKPETKPNDANAANKKKRRRISKVGGPQTGTATPSKPGDASASRPSSGSNDRFKGNKP